jgi:methyl-accepting chemotaxis protein
MIRDVITGSIRSVLGVTEREVVEAVRDTRDVETNLLGAVQAIENATASIEQHVAVIEGLATSIDPLRESVEGLTASMQDIVALMAPMAAAEREVHRVGHFFERHRHEPPTDEEEHQPGE